MNLAYTGYASDRLHGFETLVTRKRSSYRSAQEEAERLVKLKYKGDTSSRFIYSVSVSEV